MTDLGGRLSPLAAVHGKRDLNPMTAPAREIELKFLLDAAGARAVLAALPPGETVVKDLRATYFDTPDHWLSRHGFGLRVRASGGKRIQTLKSALGDDGGRDEWEWPVGDGDARPGADRRHPRRPACRRRGDPPVHGDQPAHRADRR